MSRLVNFAAASAFAVFASGAALAQGLGGIAPPPPAPEAPPPPPAAPAEAGALVKSYNLNSIKAVFDAAGVPATLEKTSGGFSYVAATLGGNFVGTAPVDCVNSDPNGECGAVVLLSGTWNSKVTPAQVNEYLQDFHLPAVLMVGDGQPMLRYLFMVNDGVGPKYLEGTLVSFAYEMQAFSEFVTKTKKGPASSFSAAPSAPEKAGKFGSTVNLGELAGPAAKGGKLTP